MIKFVSAVLFVLFSFPWGGPGIAQEASRLLIDDEDVQQMQKELDSLYLAGDYSTAVDLTLILMAYYRLHEDTNGQILCNNRMGDFLRASGNPQPSLDYLYKALALNHHYGDSLLRAQTYNYLAATYFENKYAKYLDSAETYALLSMKVALRIQNDELVSSDLNILGKVEEGKGHLDAALSYLTRALEIAQRTHSNDVPLVINNIAGVYYNQGELARSEKIALEAYSLARKYNINTYVRMSSALLERIYESMDNYRQAHLYLRVLFIYTRSFLDERIEERVESMKEQIRLTQEEAEIQKKLDRRRFLTVSLLVIIGITLVFLIVFTFQMIRLRKTNRELIMVNQEITRQKEATEKLAQELDTSNATLKKFISIIAHDLKNPFNTIIGFSDLLNTEFDTLAPEERKLAIDNTYKSAVSAFSLLEQLLNWARLQTGAFKLEITTINLSELLDEVINLLQASALLKKQSLVKKIPYNLGIYADRNMMLAVFRNLISNAIKFTPEQGGIILSASLSKNLVMVEVRDSGVGIPEREIGKLFTIDEPVKTTGTSGEKGSGIGLLLCKEYLEKNNGTISVTSREGKGTTFTVTLPLAES